MIRASCLFLVLLLVSCSCSSTSIAPAKQYITPSSPSLLSWDHSSKGVEDDGDLRILHLDGSIDSVSTRKLINEIDEANSDGKKAILLEINSPGGVVDDGILMSKAIERSKIPVSCLVDGEADSMAFYILQSCKTRIMTKRSVLMMHGPSITVGPGFGGQDIKWRNLSELLRSLERAMIEHMAQRMSITADQLAERIKNGAEWWMNWKEAKQIKAVDLVVKDIEEAKDAIGF